MMSMLGKDDRSAVRPDRARFIVITAITLALGSAPATASPISAGARSMICKAQEQGDAAILASIFSLAADSEPDAKGEITALARDIAVHGRCPLPATPAAPEPSPVSAQLEFGLAQIAGTTDSASANAAFTLGYKTPRWTHKWRAALDYRETEGLPSYDRLLAAYDVTRALGRSAFMSAVLSFERDKSAGFFSRLTQSIGFGAKLGLAPSMKLDLSGGPSLRHVEPVGMAFNDTNLGVRGAAALDWKIAPAVTLNATTSGIFEANKGTIEAQTSLNGKLIGPISTRLQLTARYETNAYPGTAPTTTTSRATLVYSF
jgi:putative salt-induced outer membrane protein